MLKGCFNRRDLHQPTEILITGATGAIGGALAKLYAKPGVTLHLQGRQQDILQQVSRECCSLGADVNIYCIDLLDTTALLTWLKHVDDSSPIDLFIANAGMNINIGCESLGENEEEMAQLLDLNVKATLLMSGYLAKAMRKRGRGKIALISSLAGFYGLPIMPSYCASKAAVKAYGEGLRGWLAGSGVSVCVVMPGNIQSAMCEAMPGPKPLMMTPESAARTIVRGLANNTARISFPFPLNLGSWFLMLLPDTVSQKILQLLGYTRPTK
ncbi:MAG: SDR family NAD(P)-dependent oxidoreductase [Paraglaciecola chathamensis]